LSNPNIYENEPPNRTGGCVLEKSLITERKSSGTNNSEKDC